MSTQKWLTCEVSNLEVAGYLAGIYGWTLERAARVASIAAVHGSKAEPAEGGFVKVTYVAEMASYVIEDHTGRAS